jgi:porin
MLMRLSPLAATALLLSGAPVLAQTVTSPEPSLSLVQPTPPAPMQAVDPPAVERLFGDWDGVQTRLEALGINLQVDAVSEFASNVSGGTRQSSSFANQIGVQNDINWERLAGLTGLSTHIVIVSRSGSSDSHAFGDNLLPVQEVYGSGGDVALHLVSISAEETLLNGRLDLAAGRMNVENDFASSPLYCNFMNNGLCGDPKALPGGDIGHSAYPDAVWAARLRVRPTATTSITAGVYEVTQGLYGDADYRSGFKFDAAQDSGVYLPVELAWEPKLGPDHLPGHYKLGFGYDTSSDYQDFGNVLAAVSVPSYATRQRTGNTQFWALADQMLLRQGSADTDGIIALAGLIHNDPTKTAYAAEYFVGAVDRGFWAARPQDTIGLLFTYVQVSARLADVETQEQALGLPLSNQATGRQSHEMFVEGNYDVHVFRGVTVEPDVQYIIRPNAQSSLHDAAVLGLKAHVEF